MPESKSEAAKNRSYVIDYRTVSAALGLILVAVVAFWQPWNTFSNRTIEVTGQASVTATADQFVLYPSYEFEGGEEAKRLAELDTKRDAVLSELKKLGVAEDAIKITADGEGYPKQTEHAKDYGESYHEEDESLLQMSVTVDNLELANKISDYLATTSPYGPVDPIATFTDAKREAYENQAREQATNDARKKAEQLAKQMGVRVNAVKTIVDVQGFGGLSYLVSRQTQLDMMASKEVDVEPGVFRLPYTIVVTYYIN